MDNLYVFFSWHWCWYYNNLYRSNTIYSTGYNGKS